MRGPNRLPGLALVLVILASGLGCGDAPAPPTELASRAPTSPESSPTTAVTDHRERANSGRIYVPTHSHIYTGQGVAEDLAVTLSIHNVSVERELVLDAVKYYDTGGKLLEEYLDGELVLAPLQTVEYFVPAKDRRGGSGANFVVGWHADSPVVRPLVEAVMIRTGGPQAYAFATRGIEIRKDSDLPADAAPAADSPAEDTGDAGNTSEGGG